jgi:NAD(P)H-flavin reductase/ferredoxin
MMQRLRSVTLNDETFHLNCGDLLLDGALLSGVELPHDCRSGVCGACRVRLVDGKVFGGAEDGGDMILACQARVVTDLRLVREAAPEPVTMSAEVADIARLAPDVTGVTIKLPHRLRHLAGQYCKLQFRGYPARCYSPSYPLEGAPDNHMLSFHIRRLRDGVVSGALGAKIRVGHRVRLTGPFGSAFFRKNHPGRTIVVSSGTGFAPTWAVAVAAIAERPQRDLVFLAAARTLQSFYMHAALCRLAQFPNVTIVPIVSEAQTFSSAIRVGRPLDYLPPLRPSDVVYAAGAPIMTEAVAQIARQAGSRCFTDAFTANVASTDNAKLSTRLADWFDQRKKRPDKSGQAVKRSPITA